jgi:hypothetical protein
MGLLRTAAILGFVGIKSAYNVGKGAINTIADGAAIVNDVCHGDFDGALNKTGKRIEKTVKAAVGSVCAAGAVLEQAAECIEDSNKTFLDKHTVENLTMITGAFIVGGIASSCIDTDSESVNETDYERLSVSDHYQIEGHGLLPDTLELNSLSDSNGVFTGDNDDLKELANMGMIDGTFHIDSEDENRSLSARNEFLNMHGFTSVPEGYEVHHVVPLCEGGADSPDNMILVTEAQHDFITSAHSSFYGWHRS